MFAQSMLVSGSVLSLTLTTTRMATATAVVPVSSPDGMQKRKRCVYLLLLRVWAILKAK